MFIKMIRTCEFEQNVVYIIIISINGNFIYRSSKFLYLKIYY